MRLRVAVGAAAALALVAGIVLGFSRPCYFELAIAGAAVLLGVLFEARRYRNRTDSQDRAGWQDTDERFIDPTSGHLMQVRFNPATGERDYVDLGLPPATPTGRT